MANFTVGDDISRKQGADLSAKLYYIVKQDTTAQQVVLASAGTDKLFGVISQVNKSATNTATGIPISVHARNASGTFKVIAGGTIAIGDFLTSDANGKAVATTTSGDSLLGIACEAGVANQIVEYMPTTGKY